jgi:hypothetical protein
VTVSLVIGRSIVDRISTQRKSLLRRIDTALRPFFGSTLAPWFAPHNIQQLGPFGQSERSHGSSALRQSRRRSHTSPIVSFRSGEIHRAGPNGQSIQSKNPCGHPFEPRPNKSTVRSQGSRRKDILSMMKTLRWWCALGCKCWSHCPSLSSRSSDVHVASPQVCRGRLDIATVNLKHSAQGPFSGESPSLIPFSPIPTRGQGCGCCDTQWCLTRA